MSNKPSRRFRMMVYKINTMDVIQQHGTHYTKNGE